MITKYKIFITSKSNVFENLKEYPFIEKIDLISIGNSCVPPDDEFVNCHDFERRLKRLLLGNLCEFQEEKDVSYEDGSTDKKPGDVISGIITDIEVESWFDFDVTIKFKVNGRDYDVHPYHEVRIFLKEERKKIIIDKTIDPYEEEDWED